jgi:hypothetical protein
MVTVSLDSPSYGVTLFDPVSVVYWDATRQGKGLHRLKHVGALERGLAYLSRCNSVWFCHRTRRIRSIGPKTYILGHFGPFRYCTKVDAKLAELVPLTHKFAKRRYVRKFRK